MITSLDKYELEFEENINGKITKVKGNRMSDKVTTQKPTAKAVKKTKNTLSVYTYLNFKRFGVAVAIDDGIKITVLWFETHIKFEKK